MRTIITILVILTSLYLLYSLLIYAFQKQFIFHPVSLPKNHIFTFDNVTTQHREVNIKADDGTELNTLIFEVEKPKGIIVYYHGNAGNLDNWGTLASEYLARGYHFLVWDYREYGKTSGKLSYQHLLNDSKVVFNYAREEYTDDLLKIPYGVSLGTAPAAHVADFYQTEHLILETPYFSIGKLARQYFPGLPYDWLLKFPLNTYKQLKKYKGAVHMIHGTADEVIPYKHSKMLKNAFPEKVHLTTVLESGHNDLPFYETYDQWLNAILGEKRN